MSPSRKQFIVAVPAAIVGGGLLWKSLADAENGAPVAAPAGSQQPGPMQWFDIRAFGAKGDSTTDDGPAIQAAVDAAEQAGMGTTLWAPPGAYAVSRTIEVRRHGTRVHFDGTLMPYGKFSGFLMRLSSQRSPSKRGNDNWQGKIDITRMFINGKYQARGLEIRHVDHALISSVLIERTKGTGLSLSVVRESDLMNVTLAGCDGGDEPNVLIDQDEGDGTNNVRFYGLTVTYSTGQALRVDSQRSPSRNLFFFGAQLHYLDYAKPWGAPRNDIALVELLNANNITFLGGNLRIGQTSTGTVIRVGRTGKAAGNVTFLGATISGGAKGALGIDVVSGRDVSVVGSTIDIPKGTRARGRIRGDVP